MAYTLFSISAYIFMRAFEVMFNDKKEEKWYKISIRIIAGLVLFTGVAAMLLYYFKDLHLLGFDPK